MPSARAGFRPRILISLWWSRRVSAGCPDRSCTTNRWLRLRKRFSFAIVLMSSTPPTPIMGAAGLPLCLKKRGFPWVETVSGRRCERWESMGFTRLPVKNTSGLAPVYRPGVIVPLCPRTKGDIRLHPILSQAFPCGFSLFRLFHITVLTTVHLHCSYHPV